MDIHQNYRQAIAYRNEIQRRLLLEAADDIFIRRIEWRMRLADEAVSRAASHLNSDSARSLYYQLADEYIIRRSDGPL